MTEKLKLTNSSVHEIQIEPQNLFFAITFSRPGDWPLDRYYNTYVIYRGAYGFAGCAGNRKWYHSYKMIDQFATIIFQLHQLDRLDEYSDMVYDALNAALLQANQKDVVRQNDDLMNKIVALVREHHEN